MTTWIVALLSAVVGAAAAGIVQVSVAWHGDRRQRNRQRVAIARLLFYEFACALSYMRGAKLKSIWPPMSVVPAHWDDAQADLAELLTFEDWQALRTAATEIEMWDRLRPLMRKLVSLGGEDLSEHNTTLDESAEALVVRALRILERHVEIDPRHHRERPVEALIRALDAQHQPQS